MEMGGSNGHFLVNDGNFNNEYTGIKEHKSKVQPYTRVVFSDVLFERNGGMYQVPSFEIYIDSIVLPQLDTCWRFFAFQQEEPYSIYIKKERLKSLLSDSFGYNACTQKVEWTDTTMLADVMSFSSDLRRRSELGRTIPSFQVHSKSNLNELLDHIDTLRAEDYVRLDKQVYVKNGRYSFTPGYSFRIADDPRCYGTLNAERPNIDSFSFYIDQIRSVERIDFPCLTNSQGDLLRFDLKTYAAKTDTYSADVSSENGNMIRYMLFLMERLSLGDKVIIQNIRDINNSSRSEGKYEDIIVTINQ